ncbi:MAG: DNA-binding response regulator, partial [Bradyrhizobium sp.]|nr:DNA-binding response regulator [Bradyrhizobium sp.]
MSNAASNLTPAGRLRVAVHAADPLRRTALGKVIAEAGHVVVGGEDTADVVLVDGDCPRSET